jgi:hypothetical protein
MGLGMLFAGAMTGGAKAVGSLADEEMKRRERAEVRQQSIMDRRNELLYEMDLKSKLARQEEEIAADAFTRIGTRGEEIGNERGARELESARGTLPNEGEFANEKITPEMIESMPPAARAIYEKEMGLTDDTELQYLRDQVTASGEVGAPASVRKAVADNFKEGRKADKEAQDRQIRAEQEEGRNTRAEASLASREAAADKRTAGMLTAAGMRSRSGGSDDDSSKNMEALHDIAIKERPKEPKPKVQTGLTRRDQEAADDENARLKSEYKDEMSAWEAEYGEDVKRYRDSLRPGTAGKSSSAAPKPSPAKDNATTKSQGGVPQPKDKAAFDALPKGARFQAPDGSIRIKP